MIRRSEGASRTVRNKHTFTGPQRKIGDLSTVPQSPSNRYTSLHRQIASNTTPWLPATPLGQVLLEAARLYEKMALLADEQLVQQHLLGSEPLHPRLKLSQACAGSFSDHHTDSNRVGGKSHSRSETIMVDQVWLRIVDRKMVITSFPQRYGREAGDPHSLYRRVRKRLEIEVQDVEVTTFDIAVVVLDECISSFFQQPEADMEAVPFGIVSVNKRLQELVSQQFQRHIQQSTFKPSLRVSSL